MENVDTLPIPREPRSPSLSLLDSMLSRAEGAEALKNQITDSVITKLQASDFREFETADGGIGVMFSAKIKPMRPDGSRGTNPASMTVFLSDEGDGFYAVEVRHVTRKAGAVTHASQSRVRENMLTVILKGL